MEEDEAASFHGKKIPKKIARENEINYQPLVQPTMMGWANVSSNSFASIKQ